MAHLFSLIRQPRVDVLLPALKNYIILPCVGHDVLSDLGLLEALALFDVGQIGVGEVGAEQIFNDKFEAVCFRGGARGEAFVLVHQLVGLG